MHRRILTHYRLYAGSISMNKYARIEIDMAHIGEYDPTLLGYLRNFPARTLPCLESAAVDALESLLYTDDDNNNNNASQRQRSQAMDEDDDDDYNMTDNDAAMNGTGDGTRNDNNTNNNNTGNSKSIDEINNKIILHGLKIHVMLKGCMKTTPLRQIKSHHVNQLMRVTGVVISISSVRTRAIQLHVRCSKCNDSTKIVNAEGPFGSIKFPMSCNNLRGEQDPCGPFPFVPVPDESIFVDQQTLKLQETPESIPTGEMPRNVLITVERSLCDTAIPGTRLSILCIPTLYTNSGGATRGTAAPTKAVYLRVVGMQKENDLTVGESNNIVFTPGEEEAFCMLAKRPDVYDILFRSIAPNIQGSYTVDIKKALLCQLMGGSRKRLSDGVKLRGDINILLLGDPSMAKSQFLKYVSKVAPIGVYTSGKGSSAAGLTASVIRDSKGEFFIEGGAMVLADGGIVCIDEFDKMRPMDRVAIHEAMEQQTISIAKAGITTVLNSRASVLAAANPVYGRYDDYKSAGENIDLMTTILSRFDMIFLVRDTREEDRDQMICQHVMGVHISNSRTNGNGSNPKNIFGHTRPSGSSLTSGNNTNNSRSNDFDGLFLVNDLESSSPDENTTNEMGYVRLSDRFFIVVAHLLVTDNGRSFLYFLLFYAYFLFSFTKSARVQTVYQPKRSRMT
jgi:DNA replicative helicase MCM subunit Mcm2 (Cdc46/Mcm family)